MDTLTCCDCSAKRKHYDKSINNEKPLSSSSSSNAKVQIENECQLLRETFTSQQESIQDLYAELDEERNAASTAANEAMSMILRLQREKAEIEMELRQFKRFSEDKMEHDQRELLALEDLVYKREQTIQALRFEAQAYRHRMMSYGVSIDDDVEKKNMFDECDDYPFINVVDDVDKKNMYDECEYPFIKCCLNENPEADVDVEKSALSDSPLKSLEVRISEMERVPPSPRHFRKVSSSSLLGANRDQRPGFSVDNDDDMDDRVYTIDSVHQGVSRSGDAAEKKVDGCGGELNQPDLGDPDIVKLYARMQALEADRESMREAIVSMRTEKAQMVLLKEIAQHLSKDVVSEPRLLPLRKASIVGVFSFLSVFKWITSFVFWRKKARRSKYMNGVLGNNMGLEMVLEKTPRIRQWRCLSSTQV